MAVNNRGFRDMNKCKSYLAGQRSMCFTHHIKQNSKQVYSELDVANHFLNQKTIGKYSNVLKSHKINLSLFLRRMSLLKL